MRLGCRVVELDCYDHRGSVTVTHGGTFTSRSSFKGMILAIKESAFVSSDYPVILTLENHCKASGQRVIASTLVSTLGDALYVPTPGDRCTPASLKRRRSRVRFVRTLLARSGVPRSSERATVGLGGPRPAQV